jgi:hypothetical protein
VLLADHFLEALRPETASEYLVGHGESPRASDGDG